MRTKRRVVSGTNVFITFHRRYWLPLGERMFARWVDVLIDHVAEAPT